VVITDSGEQFASRIFKSFLAEMGISQQFTAPYTPQENPLSCTAFLANEYFAFRALLSAIPKWSHYIKNKLNYK